MRPDATTAPTQVRRESGTLRVRWGRVGLLAALAASCAALVWVYFFAGVFSVSVVEVRGNRRLDASYLEELSGIGPWDNLITFDRGEALGRLKREPWIKSVALRRHFPDRVEILVEEREALAQVGGEEGYFLVDDGGYLIECSPQPWAGYPLLELDRAPGLEVSGSVDGDDFRLLAEALCCMGPDMRARISSLALDERRGITLFTVGGIAIYMGSGEGLEEKERVAFAIMDDEGVRRKYPKIRYIDVSSPDDPVISPV